MSRPEQRSLLGYCRPHWRGFLLGIIALILTQAFALAIPQLLRVATDGLLEGQSAAVTKAALGMIAVAVFGTAARIASRVLMFNTGRRVEYALRADLYTQLQRLGADFYQRMPLGQVMSRLVNDLTSVRLILGPGLLNLTNTSLVYLVVLPLLFYKSWQLALSSLLPLPIVLGLGSLFSRRMYDFSVTAQDRLGRLSAKVQENLAGAMSVRAYQREAAEEAVFSALNDDYMEANLELARMRGILFPMMGLAASAGSLILLAVGAPKIVAGAMTIGEFVEFGAYLALLAWPTIALGWMISLIQRGRAAMARVNEIFEAEPGLKDGPAAPPARAEGALSVRGLSYRYPGAEAEALCKLSFEVGPGQLVAVVGRTGAGKSTLLEALARMLPIAPGQLWMDGADVTTLPLSAVRARIGYAPQEAFLFSRSLQDNVRFGRPAASEAEVAAALKTAAFDPGPLGEGLDTVVGERGVALSGGQRQRATLARALLIAPEILLLDDTLSAVDTETETEILSALTDEPRTIILATHRLASAARADQILVLDEGRLVERGTEPELLAAGGLYAKMHRRQRLKAEIEETR